MKYVHLLLFVIIPSYTFAQNTAPTEAMQKISFLTGDWKGTGWFKSGEKTDSFTFILDASYRDNNRELQIDITMEATETKSVFNTQITISYDSTEKKYKTVTNNGGADIQGLAELTDDHTLLNAITSSTGLQFKIAYSASKEYKIKGERSLDKGITWVHYMGALASK